MPAPDQKFIDELVASLRNKNAPKAEHNGHADEASPTLPDGEVLERLFAEREKGDRWHDLYHGSWEAHYSSQSEADRALLLKLAFWTSNDRAQMEHIMRGSGLSRPKWDSRRGRSTWLAAEIESACSNTAEPYGHRRRHSFHHFTPYIDELNDETSEEGRPSDEGVVWFVELGEPKEREYVVDDVVPEDYATVFFGAGGALKSYAALHLGISIAGDADECFDHAVNKRGVVIYLDFELDQDEQHRRVAELCRGMGIDKPARLGYVSGVGLTTREAFKRAYRACKKHEAVALILDSMGLAMLGDMEDAGAVLDFHRRFIDPFRKIGVAPIIVDHQGKLLAGEDYQDKTPFGSAYKQWATRSVFQFQAGNRDRERHTVDVRIRHKKTNFGEELEPFVVRFGFTAKDVTPKKVTVERVVLSAEDLATEKTLSSRERVRKYLSGAGSATTEEVAEGTGLALGTVRNKLSELQRAGEVTVAKVEEDGKTKHYGLVSSFHPTYNGDEMIKSALELCGREGSNLAWLARAVMEGTRELKHLAGALAAHPEIRAEFGAAESFEDWMAAAGEVVDARAKEDA